MHPILIVLSSTIIAVAIFWALRAFIITMTTPATPYQEPIIRTKEEIRDIMIAGKMNESYVTWKEFGNYMQWVAQRTEELLTKLEIKLKE